MIKSISDKIAHKMVSSGMIEEKEFTIYSFSYEIVINYILTFLAILLIGLLFGTLLECVLFMCFYAPLRMFAGGFHAKTHERCIVASSVMFIGLSFLLFSKTSWTINPFLLVLEAGSVLLIFFLAPVETENRKIDQEHGKKYRLFSRVLLFIELVVGFVFYYFGNSKIAFLMILSHIVLSIMLLLGLMSQRFTVLKNREKTKREHT